jgi:LemA protein
MFQYGEKLTMRRRSISPVVWVIIAVVALVAFGQLIGFFALPSQRIGLDGKVGEVWNQTNRASQLLPRLEAQLKYTVQTQKQVIDKITAARSDVLAAEQVNGSDQAKVLKSATSTQIALRAFYENYPNFGIPNIQQGLLDETAGSFNRIAYARHQLIQAQVGYDQARIWFFIAAIFSPPVEVLGSDQSPLTPVAPSSLQTPPAP